MGSAGLKTGFTAGFASALIDTPLFQINLFPDLIQVYLIPAEVAVAPSLLHEVPGFGAATAKGENMPRTKPNESNARSFVRM